jgi:hypothetical protein
MYLEKMGASRLLLLFMPKNKSRRYFPGEARFDHNLIQTVSGITRLFIDKCPRPGAIEFSYANRFSYFLIDHAEIYNSTLTFRLIRRCVVR